MEETRSTEHQAGAGLLWLRAELGSYRSAFGDAATPQATINLVHPRELTRQICIEVWRIPT